jgi:uncharacterized protein (TIGR02594 family)
MRPHQTVWLAVHRRTGKFLQIRSVDATGEFGLDVTEDMRAAEHFPSQSAARTFLAWVATGPMMPAIDLIDMLLAGIPEQHPDQPAAPVRTRDELIAAARKHHAEQRATVGVQIPLLSTPPAPRPDPDAPRPTGYGVGSFAILAAVLLSLAAPSRAEARPHHRHHHSHHARHTHVRTVEPVATPGWSIFVGGVSSKAVSRAINYLGTNPTGHAHDWCADFMNLIERSIGRIGTGSRQAFSYLRYGAHVSDPKPGDIVVLRRRGGGHVGYFMNRDAAGRPIIISGNHGHRVGIGAYSPHAVVAYVRPS